MTDNLKYENFVRTKLKPGRDIVAQYDNTLGDFIHPDTAFGMMDILRQAAVVGREVDQVKRVAIYGTDRAPDLAIPLPTLPVNAIDAEMANQIHIALGLVSEACEIAEGLYFALLHGSAVDLTNVTEELGDLEFYMAAQRITHGLMREHILQENRNKLIKRYAAGFTSGEAGARADKKEEVIAAEEPKKIPFYHGQHVVMHDKEYAPLPVNVTFHGYCKEPGRVLVRAGSLHLKTDVGNIRKFYGDDPIKADKIVAGSITQEDFDKSVSGADKIPVEGKVKEHAVDATEIKPGADSLDIEEPGPALSYIDGLMKHGPAITPNDTREVKLIIQDVTVVAVIDGAGEVSWRRDGSVSHKLGVQDDMIHRGRDRVRVAVSNALRADGAALDGGPEEITDGTITPMKVGADADKTVAAAAINARGLKAGSVANELSAHLGTELPVEEVDSVLPLAMLRPKIQKRPYQGGSTLTMWRASYGDVCGWGSTPKEALIAFYSAFDKDTGKVMRVGKQ